MQQLYIITEQDSQVPVKIGISRHPEKRRRQLQTGNWRHLRIKHVIRMPRGVSPRSIETAIHRHFDDLKIDMGGDEWFQVDEQIAAATARQIAGVDPAPWWHFRHQDWPGFAGGFAIGAVLALAAWWWF